MVKMMYDTLDADILRHHPTVIVLTFGMNDSDYYIYLKPGADTAAEARLRTCYHHYLLMEKRLKVLPRIKKILVTSSPFDETARLKSADFLRFR